MIQGDVFTSFDGAKLYVDVHKGFRKTWLIFLHGFGGDSTAWNSVRSLFEQKGYSTLAVDLRGHGLSDRNSNNAFYSLENMAKDLDLLLDELGISHGILIGHCFGGMVAIRYSTMYSGKVDTLILIDTGYKLPIIGGKSFATKLISGLAKFIGFTFNIHKKNRVDYKKFIGTSDIHFRRICSDIIHTSSKSYFQILSELSRYDLLKLLQSIKVPTLIICGTADTIFPVRVSRQIKIKIPGSTLALIAGANHVLVLNNPIDLTKSITNFINN